VTTFGATRNESDAPRGTVPTIGVLALQGDFAAHAAALVRAGARPREVRSPADLAGLDGLVLPGGESTTMLHLLAITRLEQPLQDFLAQRRAPVLATCAGLILLATRVTRPEQRSFGVLDVDVERNGYGRQVHSGTFPISWSADSGVEVGDDDDAATGVFIRAPRIVRVGPNVTVLARRGDDPVLVRDGDVIGCGFHPELVARHPVHALFVQTVARRVGQRTAGGDAQGDLVSLGA
jgi:5'-phosphate synthase pdxT subunit